MLRVTLFFACTCVLACDDIALVTIDATNVRADDGGIVEEDTDIFEVDAGPQPTTDPTPCPEEVDAGPPTPDPTEPPPEAVDAGPQPTPDPAPPCEVVFDEATHVCEGDEDACEPIGDLAGAPYAVLAVWSRVAEDTFIVQVLFRGLPFYSFGEVGLIVNRSGIDAPQFQVCGGQDQACASGELFVVIPWRHTRDGTGRALYPPFDVMVIRSFGQPVELLRGPLRFARGGHLVELTLPLALVSNNGSAPGYTLFLNFSGDVNGDEGMALGGPSVGGRIDVEEEDFRWVSGDDACLVTAQLGR